MSCEKRPCVRSLPGLRREPEDLSVQTGETAAVYTHRRDGSTARGQTCQSSLRALFNPRHSTTAIPGTTLLLHPQLTEGPGLGVQGVGQAAHNPKVGVPKEAGHIRPRGEGWRLRVAQSGRKTTPQRMGGIDHRRNPVVRPMGGMIDHGDRGASCAQSFASDWGGGGGIGEGNERQGSFSVWGATCEGV